MYRPIIEAGLVNLPAHSRRDHASSVKPRLIVLIAFILVLGGCSNTAPNNTVRVVNSLSGDWQFTITNPPDQSFVGGLQGGFLLQDKSGKVTGGATYSVALPVQGGNPTVCNSGSAAITGTVTGMNVSLTAVAATQTFTFTGQLSQDGTSIVGSYSSTAGTAPDGSACGTVQSGLQWSALYVPPITGPVQGSFHSTSGPAGLSNQDFLVSGSLTEGENIGASSATVTGTLSFLDPITHISDYPCVDVVSVNGTISGSAVVLQIIGTDGSPLGQIGGPQLGSPVTFDSTARGYVLHSTLGSGYAVSSPTCQAVGSNPGDVGNICLGMTGPGCQQPVTVSPAALIFPTQALGSTTSQTITLTNTDPSSATLMGIQLQWLTATDIFGASDFNQLPNFVESDTCTPSLATTFNLAAGASCSIKISFTPQESCPWIPYGQPPSASGAPPAYCPFPLTALLQVFSPSSADSNTIFAVPVTGYGGSAIQPSTRELDFGAAAISGATLPQNVSFTNHADFPIQILGSAPCPAGLNTLPRPLSSASPVAGLQVVSNNPAIEPSGDLSSVTYTCDIDSGSLLPNFQISSDTCTGALLATGGTCSLQIAYVPQPNTTQDFGLDYFLELNTVQCTSSITSSCEIDSGRFPIELKANPRSPLRMSPAAGIDFGNQVIGTSSAKQAITLYNDPADPNTATILFVGKISAKGDYSESDDCPGSLAPGSSCTITIGFKPKILGFDPGSVSVNYSPEPTNAPQIINLRGTGLLQ